MRKGWKVAHPLAHLYNTFERETEGVCMMWCDLWPVMLYLMLLISRNLSKLAWSHYSLLSSAPTHFHHIFYHRESLPPSPQYPAVAHTCSYKTLEKMSESRCLVPPLIFCFEWAWMFAVSRRERRKNISQRFSINFSVKVVRTTKNRGRQLFCL